METQKMIAQLRSAVIAAIAVSIPMSVQAGGGSGPTGPSTAVSFEEIPGSALRRVILTEKASQRLGIEIGNVSEKQIIRTQMVGGFLTPPMEIPQTDKPVAGGAFGGFTLAGTASETQQLVKAAGAVDGTWVLVTLSPGELERVDRDGPVRVLPLATREQPQGEILAKPSKLPVLEDSKRSMLKLFYILEGKDHSLKPGQRVRVEMPLEGTGQAHKVIPYDAVYYDGNGTPWVYVNPEPLVFERQSITIEGVVGELAVISDGPPVGTRIVTVGAALLYGAEVVFKR